ncbi:uncharacterized protein LY79DRAFT_543610 [Colletotrichum navitas]|uniref:Uncharacterized protein n=1 Tax=Colletotrichum navitas TaxID=681940 RepID=A0AAD8Q7D4_9PEZI|nr:uncharacterized protein LY79DRAFT_543610 [Colletotrichum navitas]KAK1596578.1 hypothetical protein LY79DRAFT_543610 [Colletotrichum navitas]
MGAKMPCCVLYYAVLYHAVLYHAVPMLTQARTLGFGCQMGKETRPSEDNPYVKNRAHLSRLFTIHFFFSTRLTISDGGLGYRACDICRLRRRRADNESGMEPER